MLACSFISDFNYMGKIFVIKFPELNLAGIYLLKVNIRNTKTLLASFWFLIVNFEHISHLVLVFLLLTLSR